MSKDKDLKIQSDEIIRLKAEAKEKDERIQEYAEFIIRCDREGIPLLLFKDWVINY